MKIFFFLFFLVHLSHSFADDDFQKKVGKLIEDKFQFKTDIEKQQFCPNWNSQDDRSILKVQNYENFEDYEKDFLEYKEKVLAEVEKFNNEKCQIVASSELTNEEYVIRDFSFHAFPEKDEEFVEESKRWGKLRLGQMSHGEHYIVALDDGRKYQFQSIGYKGIYFDTKYNSSQNSFFDFKNSLISKKINRYGIVGREVEGGSLFYDLKANYYRFLKWGDPKYHFWGGFGAKLDQDTFIKKELEAQTFTYERLGMLSLGVVAAKEGILFDRPIEGNIFFYYKVMAQESNSVNMDSHTALSLGGEGKFFPTKYMNYFIGLSGKYNYSEFIYTELSGNEVTEVKENVALNLLLGMEF